MIYETQSIESYIAYLIGECGLSITLHPMEDERLITFGGLRRFNTHGNAYCSYVKAGKCGREKCLLQQKKVFSKMQKERHPFCGTCHAGVFEYVYPLKGAQSVIGFISVGGYACPDGWERAEKTWEALGYSATVLGRAYSLLEQTVPQKKRIDMLVIPLCQMLELAYLKQDGGTESESFMSQVLRYLQRNSAADIKVEDVCRQFGCSRSYFSHIFKRETGKGLREYLLDLRLENAKRLLALSHLSVTEISFAVGFNDSNYFSNVFKRAVGVPPLSYRKRNKE